MYARPVLHNVIKTIRRAYRYNSSSTTERGAYSRRRCAAHTPPLCAASTHSSQLTQRTNANLHTTMAYIHRSSTEQSNKIAINTSQQQQKSFNTSHTVSGAGRESAAVRDQKDQQAEMGAAPMLRLRLPRREQQVSAPHLHSSAPRQTHTHSDY